MSVTSGSPASSDDNVYGHSSEEDASMSSENDLPWSRFRARVLNSIHSIDTAGSFANYETFKSFPLPGLCIDGIGEIRLPLSPEDAQLVIHGSRQAPFGKKTETVVDQNVRKTWEIDAEKISFTNNAWHEWIQETVEGFAIELGVAGPVENVTAELHKMLLYDEDAMFKAHRDTEKKSDMFGTLIVCLPSQHTGGAVRIMHNQETKIFSTAESSAFNISCIAWYADVLHEIEPVSSGFRWVLTYNLLHASPNTTQSAQVLDKQVAKLGRTLKSWENLDPGPVALCYCLAHQYTMSGLKMRTLKGSDYPRVRCLAEACRKSGNFCVFLTSLQMVESMMNDEGGEEDKETTFGLRHVSDLRGFLLAENVAIAEEELLPQGLFHEDREPDRQFGGEYLGNQHNEIERAYQNSAMLLLARNSAASFLLGVDYRPSDVENILKRLRQIRDEQNPDPFIQQLIVDTCQLQMSAHRPRDMFIAPVANFAVSTNDLKTFETAMQSITATYPHEAFFALGSVVKSMQTIFKEDNVKKAFSMIKSLAELWECVKRFEKGIMINEALSPAQREDRYGRVWMTERVSEGLSELSNPSTNDIDAILEITDSYDEVLFENHIKPFVAQSIEDPDFVNSLTAKTLRPAKNEDSGDGSRSQRLFSSFINPSYSKFDLEKFMRAATDCESRRVVLEEKIDYGASVVVSFYRQLIDAAYKAEASQLLENLSMKILNEKAWRFDRFAISLLEKFMPILRPGTDESRSFYQTIMKTYTNHLVGNEPEKPENWSQHPANSSLVKKEDREWLSKFLQDPSETKLTIAKNQFDSSIHWEFSPRNDISREFPKDRDVVIITKIDPAHKAWQERVSKVQTAFQKLPQAELELILGDSYQDIMDLKMVRLERCVPPSVVPQKRSLQIEE